MMKKNKIILSLIIIILILIFSFLNFNKESIDDNEIIISNEDQLNIEKINTYSNDQYNFSFSYPTTWIIKSDNLGKGALQLLNYDDSKSSNSFSEGENKIEFVIIDQLNIDDSSDYPEKNKTVADVRITNQDSKKINIELTNGEKIISYYIPIPQQNKYLYVSIYGDIRNFDVLDEVVNSIQWSK